MDCYYFSANVDNARSLCISPLTDESAIAAGFRPDTSVRVLPYEKTQTGGLPDIAIIAQSCPRTPLSGLAESSTWIDSIGSD